MPTAIAERIEERLLSAREFRSFQESRPDDERWELIAGVPVMMAPAFIVHNRIGDTMTRILNEALAVHDPDRVALQRIGVELGNEGAYRPEPDFAVFDADFEVKQRFVDRVYLLGEVVSGTDEQKVPGTGRPWIEVKRELYRQHAPCLAVVILEQERIEARVDVREPDGWRSETLTGPDARLALPAFGLDCRLAALYKGTPLVPR